VSPAADTFTRFLDLVADSHSGQSRPGDDSAARLHLSRSQLDRVITAVAGETPGRLRRRILLERAAYRLVTSDLNVLDVAVEAGYSSHEAFTRAFTRSHGRPPAEWRRHPGQIRVDSPNRVHFHPPGGLRLPAQAKATSMDLLETMTDHHIWLVGQLVARATRVDPAVLDAPIEISVDGIDRSPTLRSLLSRLVGQLDMWNHAMADQPYDFGVEQHESLVSMGARLAACGPIFLGQVREACANGTLEDTFVVVGSDGSPEFFTYGGMLAHVLTYGSYRRTLVVGALSSAGVTDLEDDPLAWEPVRPVGPTLP
jgi:AraC-like DNA-binding protein